MIRKHLFLHLKRSWHSNENPLRALSSLKQLLGVNKWKPRKVYPTKGSQDHFRLQNIQSAARDVFQTKQVEGTLGQAKFSKIEKTEEKVSAESWARPNLSRQRLSFWQSLAYCRTHNLSYDTGLWIQRYDDIVSNDPLFKEFIAH